MIPISAIKRLRGILGEGNLLTDEPMAAHTTFRVGGPADAFATPDSIEAVASVAAFCREGGIPLYVMGCGSNLLVADAGLRGVVLRIGPKLADVQVEGEQVRAQAGATNAKVARAALEAGLGGFEFAAGIPGSLGGAAIMNAGAYGGELRDAARAVTCLSPAGQVVRLTADEADWGYRRSMMGERGYIVLGAELQLQPDDPAAIRARMDDLAARRNQKQPLDMPSAGSTFKRPEGHFAGKLIQDAGFQGYRVGGAQVSPKHAGFVVNAGGATAADIRQLMDDVAAGVAERFGVALQPEVRLWGFGDS